MTDYTEMIMRAIRYIEENLKGEIHLDEIATAAYCSPYHFHRLFKQIVGDTPGNYIRKRRLTEAAKELRRSNRRILDIAIDYGFDSQAAFTNAFKKHHATPPGMFRKGKSSVFSRERLTRQILQTYRRLEMTEPRIISKDAMNLMGIVYYGDGKDKCKGIEEIYVNLKKNIVSLSSRKDRDHVYGVCFLDPEFNAQTGKFNYLVGVEVADLRDIPLEMVGKTIPAGEYAVFRSKDASYDDIDPVVHQLWAYAHEWIAQNAEKVNRYFDFECYTEDEKGNLRYLEVYIPIVR